MVVIFLILEDVIILLGSDRQEHCDHKIRYYTINSYF